MRRHPPAWFAAVLAGLSLGGVTLSIAAVWLWPGLAAATLSASALQSTIEALWVVGAPVVGAVVATRRPDHLYGWLLLTLGIAAAGFEVASTYGTLALLVLDEPLPLGWAAAWLADLFWAAMVLHLPFMFLLFPDGRLPARVWRWLVRAILALAVLLFASGPFQPGQLGSVRVDNPLGVAGAGGVVIEAVLQAAAYGLFVATAVAAGSVFARRRRAGKQERLQLRWFAYGATLFAVVVTAGVGTALIDVPGAEDAVPALLTLALNGVFVAIGVAVLRYRLYEIDRLVSRTVTYALLTGLLAGVYVIVVLLLPRLLAPFATGSELSVAGATLVAAALFMPARRRIQSVVDRRFNRARFDAEQVVARFRDELRDEAGLEAVVDATRAATVASVQPAGVSLWLADAEVAR